jgi:hypothetical protein
VRIIAGEYDLSDGLRIRTELLLKHCAAEGRPACEPIGVNDDPSILFEGVFQAMIQFVSSAAVKITTQFYVQDAFLPTVLNGKIACHGSSSRSIVPHVQDIVEGAKTIDTPVRVVGVGAPLAVHQEFVFVLAGRQHHHFLPETVAVAFHGVGHMVPFIEIAGNGHIFGLFGVDGKQYAPPLDCFVVMGRVHSESPFFIGRHISVGLRTESVPEINDPGVKLYTLFRRSIAFPQSLEMVILSRRNSHF